MAKKPINLRLDRQSYTLKHLDKSGHIYRKPKILYD